MIGVVVYGICVVCWGLGLLAGYILGNNRKPVITRSEAARVLAKASWRNR